MPKKKGYSSKKGNYKPSKKTRKGSHKIKGTKAVAKKQYRPTGYMPWD